MASFKLKYLLLICVSLTILKTVNSIHCYQCSGTDSDYSFECNEFLESDVTLNPIDCGSLHDAQYCIKHVGRSEGRALECYQCDSSTTLECGDGLMHLDGGVLTPTSCDHVFEARYCIKKTGIFRVGVTEACTNILLVDNAQYTTYCDSQPNSSWPSSLKYLSKTLGGITTKRYCSSLDLGNYCNYVQQPGDKLEYRTCLFTCSSDGCNSAVAFRISAVVLALGVVRFAF